jgi:hypothetical protein
MAADRFLQGKHYINKSDCVDCRCQDKFYTVNIILFDEESLHLTKNKMLKIDQLVFPSNLRFIQGEGSLENGYFDNLDSEFENKFKINHENRKSLMYILLIVFQIHTISLLFDSHQRPLN